MATIPKSLIPETFDYLLSALADEGLTDSTINVYRRTYLGFYKYLESAGVKDVTESVCLDYLEPLLGKRLSGLHEPPGKCRNKGSIIPLYLLMNYQEEGLSCHSKHRCTPKFICHDGCIAEYEEYVSYLAGGKLSPRTVEDNLGRVKSFIKYHCESGIFYTDQITSDVIESYLLQYKNNAIKYRAKIVACLKDYFSFLYSRGYTETDLRRFLPKVSAPRSSGIPHAWTKAELSAILAAVDRENPTGKRDYAIFLLAIFTGLRCGDIRNLRLSDINWERKTINIVMSKTGKPLELPLSEEVGWSIIDYLKQIYPTIPQDERMELLRALRDVDEVVLLETREDVSRLREWHKRPFDCIGSHASLDQPLSNYMLKAGIAVKRGERYGLHSLRNTLAKNMLITGAPIVTISQVLGHEDPRTTELYLKTNVDELRFCALDPDEGMVEL